MLDRVPDRPAEVLDLPGYSADFRKNFWSTSASWKLERQESFREPDEQSWLAMERGDWPRAVRLIEAMRPGRAEHQKKLDEMGIVQYRVRIVTRPVTSYLQWELTALRLWAELGEKIRVLPAEAIRGLETRRKLPELLVLGDVLYEIQYENGMLAGARKLTTPGLVATCRNEIKELWHQGEDLLSYFNREIVSLPPPAPQAV